MIRFSKHETLAAVLTVLLLASTLASFRSGPLLHRRVKFRRREDRQRCPKKNGLCVTFCGRSEYRSGYTGSAHCMPHDTIFSRVKDSLGHPFSKRTTRLWARVTPQRIWRGLQPSRIRKMENIARFPGRPLNALLEWF